MENTAAQSFVALLLVSLLVTGIWLGLLILVIRIGVADVARKLDELVEQTGRIADAAEMHVSDPP